jgi:hypothetical protein
MTLILEDVSSCSSHANNCIRETSLSYPSLIDSNTTNSPAHPQHHLPHRQKYTLKDIPWCSCGLALPYSTNPFKICPYPAVHCIGEHNDVA